MMHTIVDSHCHLQSIDDDVEAVLANAREAGVYHCLSVCIELSDYPVLQNIADQYPQVFISVGQHPNVHSNAGVTREHLSALAQHKACIAIGETGLDFYRTEDANDIVLQKNHFRTHIQTALQTSKPLIVHTRDAAEDTLRILEEEGADAIGGVMHCFSEDLAIAERAMALNFYISFSGILTFKNATVTQEVAQKIPLDRILIETDSPYLSPVPFRGKPNRPANVHFVAQALATLRGVDYATIAKATTENFYRCFRIG